MDRSRSLIGRRQRRSVLKAVSDLSSQAFPAAPFPAFGMRVLANSHSINAGSHPAESFARKVNKREEKLAGYLQKNQDEIHRLSGEVLRLKLQVSKLRDENAALRIANRELKKSTIEPIG